MDEFVGAMRYIRTHDGTYPPTLNSIQHQNEIGDSGIASHDIESARAYFAKGTVLQRPDSEILLCLVDGFFLYSNAAVIEELDIRFLIRAPYQKLKARREARSGYVTLEGISYSTPVNCRLLARSTRVFRQNSME